MRCFLSLALGYLCLFTIAIQAQSLNYEFGGSSAYEKAMTVYPYDSSATAVILSDYGEQAMTRGDRSYLNEFYHVRRIKILDEKAIDQYANVSIDYYSENKEERISEVKVQTIQPDGSVQTLNRKNIFNEKVNEYWSKVTFAFPNVQVGSIIEYQYRITSSYLFRPKPWKFRNEIPTLFNYYRFINNLPYTYIYLLEGIEYFDKTEEGKDKQRYQLGDMSLTISEGQNFTATKVPALEEDAFITCLDDYQTKIRFQLYEIARSATDRERVMQTWEGVAKKLDDHAKFGDIYNQARFSKDLLALAKQRIDLSAPTDQKINQIRQLLDTRIKSTDDIGLFADLSPDEALAAGQTDLPTKTLSMIRLLKAFEIEAYPLLTSTRDHGRLLPKDVFVDQFNYLLIGIKKGDKIIPLDLANKDLPMGWVNPNILNREALMIEQNQAFWIRLPDGIKEDILFADLTLDDQGKLDGKLQISSRKYGSYLERKQLEQFPSAVLWQQRISDQFPTNNLLQFESNQPTKSTEAIKSTGEISIPDAALINGDLIYLSPILYSQFKDPIFEAAERNFPIEFPYGFSERNVIRIKIPEAWTVEELPEKKSYALNGGRASFSFDCSQNGNELNITTQFLIKEKYYLPQEYPSLRELFDLAIEKLNEQIVLKKS